MSFNQCDSFKYTDREFKSLIYLTHLLTKKKFTLKKYVIWSNLNNNF